MAMRYHIDPASHCVWSQASGTIENDDLLLHIHKLKKDPDFRPEYDHILDLTQITDNRLSQAVLQESGRINAFSAQSRRAVIASQDEVFDFIKSLDQTDLPVSPALRAFRNEAEALNWLQRQPAC